ncbi:hypothetical protein Cgig2_020204 [Carnegiea gigantea]|uniref:Uncharacterized protein n=1 Tax=Carnegiea gigantea TaxID=171969 RepID=A0A9Q1QQ91_9CARY|nr:hypothetical protein Cgig2_020204 [Carnegiea gigantea]
MTKVMAVIVPVAAAGGPDHGPRGSHDAMGQSEEDQLRKTDKGTEPTTAANSTPTVAVGDAPILQGGQNMSALLGAVDTGEEPITVRDSETTTIVDATGPTLVRYDASPYICSRRTWCPSTSHSLTVPHCGTSCMYTHPLVVVYPGMWFCVWWNTRSCLWWLTHTCTYADMPTGWRTGADGRCCRRNQCSRRSWLC